jgi:hypothetical protein
MRKPFLSVRQQNDGQAKNNENNQSSFFFKITLCLGGDICQRWVEIAGLGLAQSKASQEPSQVTDPMYHEPIIAFCRKTTEKSTAMVKRGIFGSF